MAWFSSETFKFTAKHKRLLKKATIDPGHGPGTVLHDFDVLLTFILERDLRVTGQHQLPLSALPEINARLAHPIEHGLQRPQQKSFPHIHGLYLLVRASGLTHVDEAGSKPHLLVDDDVYQQWQGLNATERYGTLLETWFLWGKPEILGEHRPAWSIIPDNFRRSLSFFLEIPKGGKPIAGDSDAESGLPYTPGWHNLGLMDLFGLIDVKHAPPEPGEGWRIERVARTSFGEALFTLLQVKFFGDFDRIMELEEHEEPYFGILQPILQPYFPKWQDNLSIAKWMFREGTYVFKVCLADVWRRIAIPADSSLDTLAAAILDAVEFDHDHLYEFSYRNRSGVRRQIQHPLMEEEPSTDEVLVGEVPIRVGQTMTYLFDFGDQWEFDVTLEQVDSEMDVEGPEVLEKHGEPPEQYWWPD